MHEDSQTIYLAVLLRNVGAGIAQLLGYRLEAEPANEVTQDPLGLARHRRGEQTPDSSLFVRQQRDLYVPAGDLGFWQATLRDPQLPQYQSMSEAIRTGGRLTVDLLYSDHGGGQSTITRFVLLPDPDSRWRCDVAHHWNLSYLNRPR